MNDRLSGVGVQKYCQRLVDHSLISFSHAKALEDSVISPSTPDYPRCPICSHRLAACPGCSSVTCGNSWCTAANLVKCLSSCRSCFSTVAMKKCNEHDCQSRAHFNGGTICPDCVRPLDGHIVCSCGEIWVCGACATQKKILNKCGRCPKCQNFFCFFRCRYIDACADCHKLTLCNDCVEEDISDVEGISTAKKGTSLVATCEECQSKICADCLERESCCESCESVHCQDCTDNDECSDCGALICLTCQTEAGCQQCDS
ncbi:hypothetical protein DEU56DRAFT_165744 [Suillus clintonianus]|uniref:uncharacterized protein n=1 Tax=Suillus clintonianus TaxID=1904413 RepID=UPI001B884EED|nr:uncharacterized protein DEU56DRAFT_165744 [Suillus clintonianus]KAG2116381.1 hypothetical protein DEU56DRAFT_165744 [Suillus clintonianus]